jgi:uncharacterized iron-regulated membrane protein
MISESLRLFLHNPRKLRYRSWAFNVHLYAGMTVGLILAAITLSGSAIVFRNAIGFALHPIDPTVKSQVNTTPSLQWVIDRTRSQNPGFTVGEVDGFSRNDGLRLIRLRRAGHDGSDRDVFIDSRTGELVSGHPHLTNVLGYLEDFHKNLLMGRPGRGVNGVIAILFVAIVLTAPIVWWPGIGKWARAVKINLALSWKRVNYDLHSAVGIVCLLFLSIMSVTAVVLATPDVLHLAESQSSHEENHEHHHRGARKEDVARTVPSRPEARQRRADAANPADGFPSLDLAVDALKKDTAFADWNLWSIRFPEGDGPLTAELHRGTSSMEVDVDPRSARIMNVGEPKGYGVSMDAHNFVETLHFGRVGGRVTQALWVLLGLCPTLLAITGYLMWWNRAALWKKIISPPRSEVGCG